MTALPVWEPWQLAVALALGLVFGSFANVCIHRLPQGRSVAWPGSSCPVCGAPIAWYDNIPVISWMLLLGRCRRCRAPISWRYPLVEAIAALLLVQLCLRYGLTLRWAALSYLALSILVLVPIDWRHGILPDVVTLPGLAVGLLTSMLTEEPGRLDAMLGAAVGGLVPLTIRGLYMVWARARRAPGQPAPPGEGAASAGDAGTASPASAGEDDGDLEQERREGMGLGDVKMLAMVGAFLGVSNVLLTMLLGSVIGTLYVLPLLVTGRQGLKTAVPFGPFLGLGAVAAMFFGHEIVSWYLGAML